MQDFVPTTWISRKPTSHPWLSKASWQAIADKRNAEGTDDYIRLQQRAKAIIYDDYGKYVGSMKKKVDLLSNCPKQWWKLSSELMLKDKSSGSIPPSKDNDGTWAMTPKTKADLLAKTFNEKFVLPSE